MALLAPGGAAKLQVAREGVAPRNSTREFRSEPHNSRCIVAWAAATPLALRAHREQVPEPTAKAALGSNSNRWPWWQAGRRLPIPVGTPADCQLVPAASWNASGILTRVHRLEGTGSPSRGSSVTVRALGGGSFIGRPWSGEVPQQQWAGQQVAPPQAQAQQQTLPGGLQVEQLMTLESNIDDMSPQLMAFTCEKLLEAGALDVWTTAFLNASTRETATMRTHWAIMKKGRPGMILHVLCSQEAVNNMLTVIFYETTSLGVRIMPCDRVSVQRVVESVSTQWGFIPVKAAFIHGQLVTATAEYENCAEVARQQNVPLKVVKSAAEEAYIQSEMRERQSLSG